jgi:uncharacterized membrane protein
MQASDHRLSVLVSCLMALTLIRTGAIAGFFYAYTSSVMRGLLANLAGQRADKGDLDDRDGARR